MADQFLRVGMLIPIAGSDLNADDKTPGFRPGGLSFVIDAFGPRIFQYVRNQSGSVIAQGDVVRKVADVTAVNITSGTTTSATKVAAFTADKHEGMLLYVDDNDSAAGGAPEGEVSVIVSNTADVATVDSNRKFTVALAVNDDVRVVATYHAEDAVDNDPASRVLGCVVGEDGVTDKQYGWVQNHGIHPAVLHTAVAVAAGGTVVAAAKAVADAAADTVDLWIGTQVGTFTADLVTLLAPVDLRIFGALGGV